MRRSLLLFTVLTALAALPMAAQNTDIESLSGLQFNFANPGARSLGMGGAFIGLADDASAAEANPAGLTILRKPEVSIEARNYRESQVLTTSGTFPDVGRTSFNHYSDRAVVNFASFVYPIKNFAIAGYYHEPLKNFGAGAVVPTVDQFGQEVPVPNFFLPKGGGQPISAAACLALRQQQNDPFACVEFDIKPFITAVDINERTFGLAGAWRIGNFSVGVTGRYHIFRESAFTYRVIPLGQGRYRFDSISVQATGDDPTSSKRVKDTTFSGGFKWAPNDKFSVGGVYKKGATFDTSLFAANANTNFEYVRAANTTFHVPDIAGLGVSFRPIPVLTLNADAVRVKYSNLVDNLVSTVVDVQDVPNPYKAKDVMELHAGAEYFFSTKIPFAVRGGYWRDPAHSVTYQGPTNIAEGVAAALLYPKGTTQNHFSIGAGVAWPRFQIDAAYDTSKYYKVGSLSLVTRF